MLKTETILLTGITGAVGSWIAREALRRGLQILALVRDETDSAARIRVRSVLDIMGAGDLNENVEIVRGDICVKELGVDNCTDVFGHVSMIFHCAASTEFNERNSRLSHKVNVEGTANVLKVAANLHIPICHISTAYIAGLRQGIVKESETDVGQAFNNIYERTKCQAEVLVNNWTLETGLPALIFRPSIVIGDSQRGRIVNFNGMYNILRLFDTIAPIIGDEEIRVVAKVDATKNFIPVDYLAKAVWYIIDHGIAGTYHITNPEPLTLAQLRDIYSNLFCLNGKLVDENDFRRKKPTRAELLYRKASSLYMPYLAAEPIFDRINTHAVLKHTNLEVPVVDTAYFVRLLEYAKSVQWGKPQAEESELSAQKIVRIKRYFDDFLTKKIHKQLLPNLRKLSATFRIIVKERPQMCWSLAIERGALTSISQNGMVCDCSFVVDADTFSQIAAGRLAPQKAFFRKRVDITGDIETGLKLVTVLAAFFKKYPYDVEAC